MDGLQFLMNYMATGKNKIKHEPYFKNAENWENVTNAMEMK